jgi:hypothetical protein
MRHIDFSGKLIPREPATTIRKRRRTKNYVGGFVFGDPILWSVAREPAPPALKWTPKQKPK